MRRILLSLLLALPALVSSAPAAGPGALPQLPAGLQLPPGFQLPAGTTLPPGVDLDKLLREMSAAQSPGGSAAAPQPQPQPDQAPPSVVPRPSSPASQETPAPEARTVSSETPTREAGKAPGPVQQTAGPPPSKAEAAPEPPPPAAKPEELRNVLAEMKNVAAPDLGGELPVFGFDLFQGSQAFQPLQGMAVPDAYVVGPGDSFKVSLWGRLEGEYTLTVDPEGRVLFPKVGPVRLSGLTYAEARQSLRAKAEAITGVSAAVALGGTRTFQVFVVGEAQKPGTYTLPPFSTVLHSIVLAGGPTSLGSLRRISLRRGGKTISELDLYGFILQGSAAGDRPLQNGDVVAIPRAETKVWAYGKIKRPAVYELRPGEGLRALLDFAGGLTADAFGGRIQVERAEKNRARVVLDVPYAELRGDYPLQDGDAVRVFPLRPEVENRVALYGHVFQPGTYAFSTGMRVSNLLRSPESLKPDVDLSYAVVLREVGPDRSKQVLPLRLGAALDGSDPSQNLDLQPRDEVYVFSKYQFRKPLQARAAGQLNSPGLYRFERGATVADLIRLAGGLAPEALLSRAELQRYLPDRTLSSLSLNLSEALRGNPRDNLALEDEDTLVIHSVKEPVPERVVAAVGEVQKPGKIPLTQGMRAADLIFAAGDLTKDAYLEEAHVFRTHLETKEVSFLRFNLRKALAGDEKENLELQDLDRVVVYSAANLVIQGTVKIEGMVKKPGDFDLGTGMRAADLVLRADGLTKEAYPEEAHVYRTDPVTKKLTIRVFNLGKALAGDPAENLLLQDLDQVVIHSAYEFAPAQSASILGAVNRPAAYRYAQNMRVRDLILIAGGLAERAYLDQAEIKRSLTVAGTKTETRTIVFNLAKALESDPAENLALEPYDKVLIRTIPEWKEERTVLLQGEVTFPGTYYIAKEERLSAVIKRAGGFTAEAYLYGATFTRESVRLQQQARLNELRDRLQQALLRASSSEIQSSLSKEDVDTQKQYLATQEALLKRLDAAKATGRVVVKLLPLSELEGSEWDVALEDSDAVTVPKRPQTVNVIGQVYNPTSLLWEPNQRAAGHYLLKTGGATADAEKAETYVVRADGTVVSSASYNEGNWWSRGIESLELNPGDTVLVPEKVLRVNYMKEIRDITQILYQIAVTAGVLLLM